MTFNQQQLEFINYNLTDIRLIGNPGGGKTRSAIEYIVKHITKPSEFIMITFSITILFFIDQIYLQFLLLFLATALITYIARIPSRITAVVSETDPE